MSTYSKEKEQQAYWAGEWGLKLAALWAQMTFTKIIFQNKNCVQAAVKWHVPCKRKFKAALLLFVTLTLTMKERSHFFSLLPPHSEGASSLLLRMMYSTVQQRIWLVMDKSSGVSYLSWVLGPSPLHYILTHTPFLLHQTRCSGMIELDMVVLSDRNQTLTTSVAFYHWTTNNNKPSNVNLFHKRK